MSNQNGNKRGAKTNDQGLSIFTTVDDETFDELAELTGERIVHVAIWEESLADELDDMRVEPEDQTMFDVDLYLEDGIYFELYGTTCFPSLDSNALMSLDTVSRVLLTLVNQSIWLEEVAVDDDEQLVLVLGQDEVPRLYLVVGGWMLDEWDELPDD